MSQSYQDICNLYYRYSELMTLGEFDAVGEMFKHGRVTSESTGKASVGAREVAEMYRDGVKVDPDKIPDQVLITSNVQVYTDEEAGTATGKACFTAMHEDGKGGITAAVAGRYRDTFERIDGRWWFASRHIMNDLAGDISLHVPPHIFAALKP